MIKKHLSQHLFWITTAQIALMGVYQRPIISAQKGGYSLPINTVSTLQTEVPANPSATSLAQNRRGPRVAPASGAAREGALKKYVITCPVDIRVNEPVEVVAKDRIWAMVALRCTVWTEAEWKDHLRIEEDMKNICAKVGCGTPVPIQK